MQPRLIRTIAASAATSLLALSGLAQAANWYPYRAEVTQPPFAADGKVSMVEYVPLAKASKKWKICVSFPHMKDAYWLGVVNSCCFGRAASRGLIHWRQSARSSVLERSAGCIR